MPNTGLDRARFRDCCQADGILPRDPGELQISHFEENMIFCLKTLSMDRIDVTSNLTVKDHLEPTVEKKSKTDDYVS